MQQSLLTYAFTVLHLLLHGVTQRSITLSVRDVQAKLQFKMKNSKVKSLCEQTLFYVSVYVLLVTDRVIPVHITVAKGQ